MLILNIIFFFSTKQNLSRTLPTDKHMSQLSSHECLLTTSSIILHFLSPIVPISLVFSSLFVFHSIRYFSEIIYVYFYQLAEKVHSHHDIYQLRKLSHLFALFHELVPLAIHESNKSVWRHYSLGRLKIKQCSENHTRITRYLVDLMAKSQGKKADVFQDAGSCKPINIFEISLKCSLGFKFFPIQQGFKQCHFAIKKGKYIQISISGKGN